MNEQKQGNLQQLAEHATQSMYARDRASQYLGITLDEVRPGYARMSMTVADWMIQGHEVCHGGLMFALADTAMAFASNSHNEQHTALNANIDFLRPARAGENLTAEAQEDNRTRRTGMYNVSIVNGAGETLCYFRGRTYGIGGAVVS
jgi:acyl-CoA thioesterase